MSSPLLRFLRVTGLSALAALIYGLIRSTRREPTPPPSGAASWDPLDGDDAPPARSGPVTFTDTGSSTTTTEPETEATPDAEPEGEAEAEATPEEMAPQGFAAVPDTTAEEPASGWVGPDADGGCPASHPIKGNDQSKIFHVPGGLSYERTKAERCYCDEASAEADGYRKAKR